MRSEWRVVEHDEQHQIVFIEDLNRGKKSVTNDAENVLRLIQNDYGAVRLVYRDSMGEWAEIIWKDAWHGEVDFLPWDGLTWDILKGR